MQLALEGVDRALRTVERDKRLDVKPAIRPAGIAALEADMAAAAADFQAIAAPGQLPECSALIHARSMVRTKAERKPLQIAALHR
jgi:cob(I)alamin adenosyltransferase